MSYPTTPVPNNINISGVSPTRVSTPHSLKRQVRSNGTHRWVLDITYPPMARAEFMPLWAFCNDQNGQYEEFTYTPPLYKDTQGTCSTCTVNGSHTAGDTSIDVNITGTLLAGDFIKFTGHDKVYTLTGDATTSLSIHPALQSDLTNAETVIYSNVPFTVALASDSVAMQTVVNQLITGYKVTMVEVI